MTRMRPTGFDTVTLAVSDWLKLIGVAAAVFVPVIGGLIQLKVDLAEARTEVRSLTHEIERVARKVDQ